MIKQYIRNKHRFNGFHSFLGQNRTQFNISFFIFALLFLLFDLEILLVYPYIVSAYNNSIYGLVNMLIFFLVLTLGFAFELGKKALSIDSRQTSDVANKETSIVSKYSNKEKFNKVSYINNSIRHMSSMKKKTIFQRLLIGGKLGWNTPTLPENVIKFQMNPLIRILRVLGGISTILLLSNKVSSYSMYVFYLVFFFAFLFFIYHIIILVIRFKHIYKILKSDKLDVRNSPLDHFARLSARLILCAKGVCDGAQPVGVSMGIMLGIDTVLERADHKAIFGPALGNALKTVLPNNSVEQKTIDLIKGSVSEIDKNNDNMKQLNEIIDNISDWSETDKDIKKDASEIIQELNKQKDDISKNSSKLRSEINNLLKSNPFKKD